MDYLRVNDAEKSEVMQQLKEITNKGALVDKIFYYLQEHNNLLSNDEYVKIKTEYPKFPPGTIGMIIMNTKYSVNIKKATIVIIAFLLDIGFSKGLANLFLSSAGFSLQVLQKIKDKEKCLVLDILMGNKKDEKDFDFYNKECVQNDIECSFRDEYICKRSLKIIRYQIKNLKSKQIIHIKNGVIKQTF